MEEVKKLELMIKNNDKDILKQSEKIDKYIDKIVRESI